MAVLTGRPLAFGCLALVATLLLSFFLPSAVSLLFSLLFFFFFAAFLVLSFRSLKKGYCFLFIALFFLGSSLGFFRGGTEVRKSEKCPVSVGEMTEMTFTVREVLSSGSYYEEVLVKVNTVGGQKTELGAILRSEAGHALREGDRLSCHATRQELSFENRYSGREKYYTSLGAQCLFVAEGSAPFVPIESGSRSFLSRIKFMRDRLSYSLRQSVPGEEGNLLSALLLGTKEFLSDTTVRDFRRIGISHLLALSGLHLSILSAAVDQLLRMLRVSKKIRIPITLFFAFSYLIMTGCGFSTLRAVLMLSVFYLSFFAKSDIDAVTSLLFGAAVILLIWPFALQSLSFQMTVLSTFGILVFSSINKKCKALIPVRKGFPGIIFAILRWILSSFVLTFSATVAILPVIYFNFGELSLLTPVSNLIFVPLASFLLVLALLALFCFPVAPFAFAAGKLSGFVLWLSGKLAMLPAVVSLRPAYTKFILLPGLFLTFLLLIPDLKKRKWLVPLPAVLCVAALCFSFPICNRIHRNDLTFSYRLFGTNEGIILRHPAGTVIVDISATSVAQLYADYELASEDGATEVSVLLLTHYHKSAVNAFDRFAGMVLVRNLWVPEPVTQSDKVYLDLLRQKAALHGVTISLYSFGLDQKIFYDGRLTFDAPLYESRSTQPTVSFTLAYGPHEIRYESCALSEYRSHLGMPEREIGAELFILGAHGPRPKERIHFSTGKETQTILVASKRCLPFMPETAEYRVLFPNPYRCVFSKEE